MNRTDKEFLVKEIRARYTEKEYSSVDALKELDRKVKRPADIFAYAFGSVGAVVMGSGMSLVMTEIGTAIGLASGMIPGIILGTLGLGMALANYPIYKRILDARRKQHAGEVIALSDKILAH